MRIPDSKIDEIRSASDIVDVVSSYIALKKRGKNYLGLCPFHQEKTPSFNVSPEKQMYHCFGCGVGGNVFTFVMEHDKVSFVEAVRTLAERAGIALPASDAEDRTRETENETLYAACKMAALFFRENLTKTVEGKLALEYFHHRGFSDDTISTFGLGYAMHSWDALIRRAAQESTVGDILDRAGLVVKREDNSGYYDRFRGRAMFPIASPSGRTIGFGARKLREDDPLGKYINSPETPIYDKSRSLYGLFHAKEAIREREYAVLVEGYADLISVYQAGVQNIVASSGTALTEEQIRLVGRYAKAIILVYDGDSAGSKATMRGVDLIIEHGLDVRVASLPAGDDPDSFVRKNGGDAFRQLLDGAVSFLDFKARLFRDQGMLATPEGQTRAVRSIVETIARMKDELKRNFYVKSVAEKYGIYESVLFRELEKLIGRERSQVQGARPRASEPTPAREGEQIRQVPVAGLPAVERDLLKLMLENGTTMVSFIMAHAAPSDFNHASAQAVLQHILRHVESGQAWDAGTLVNEIEDAMLKHFVADLVFSRYELSRGWREMDSFPEDPDPMEVAEQCLLIVQKQRLEELLGENQRRMKAASSKGEPVIEYMEEHQALLRKKKELETTRLIHQGPVLTGQAKRE